MARNNISSNDMVDNYASLYEKVMDSYKLSRDYVLDIFFSVLVASHFYGNSYHIVSIGDVCSQYNSKVITDLQRLFPKLYASVNWDSMSSRCDDEDFMEDIIYYFHDTLIIALKHYTRKDIGVNRLHIVEWLKITKALGFGAAFEKHSSNMDLCRELRDILELSGDLEDSERYSSYKISDFIEDYNYICSFEKCVVALEDAIAESPLKLCNNYVPVMPEACEFDEVPDMRNLTNKRSSYAVLRDLDYRKDDEVTVRRLLVLNRQKAETTIETFKSSVRNAVILNMSDLNKNGFSNFRSLVAKDGGGTILIPHSESDVTVFGLHSSEDRVDGLIKSFVKLSYMCTGKKELYNESYWAKLCN